MKIIDKLTPRFIKEYDQRLLLSRPVLWVFKLHHLFFFQLVLSVLTCLFCWVHPQGLNNFPHDDVIVTVVAVLNGLLVLLWIFYANQFDLRTRHVSKPRWYDQYRMGSYLLAGLFVIFNAMACYTIFQVNTTRVMLPLDDDKFAALDSVVDDFFYKGEHYADGFYLESVFHKETERFLRKDTVWYHPDTVLRRCQAIGKLNAKWGNGTLITGAALYDSIIDSVGMSTYNGKPYSIAFHSRVDCLQELKNNLREVESSYQFLHEMPGDLEEFTWASLMILILVLGILYLLILYFKYFGIYQLITGVLSPVLLYFLFGLLSFLWFVVFVGMENPGLVLASVLLTVLTIFTYYKGFTYRSTSKKQIVLLQSIVVVVPTLLFILYFGAIEGCYHCSQFESRLLSSYESNGDPIFISNPVFQACLSKQALTELIARWVLLLVYAFVLFPLNTKMFYRQYYLPRT